MRCIVLLSIQLWTFNNTLQAPKKQHNRKHLSAQVEWRNIGLLIFLVDVLFVSMQSGRQPSMWLCYRGLFSAWNRMARTQRGLGTAMCCSAPSFVPHTHSLSLSLIYFRSALSSHHLSPLFSISFHIPFHVPFLSHLFSFLPNNPLYFCLLHHSLSILFSCSLWAHISPGYVMRCPGLGC